MGSGLARYQIRSLKLELTPDSRTLAGGDNPVVAPASHPSWRPWLGSVSAKSERHSGTAFMNLNWVE
ncbi:hypothetical protein E2C01_004026 [Portunus trituberculatus]|uniref:Uncharacterized protein n=1 Tax=Portunus trituberculatus TaxID=210409 RepID=A0A5B7CRR7_PORTR|nr:hypothetical protein [Portunus trituberculatus]